MTTAISAEIYQQTQALCLRGDALIAQHEYNAARALYLQALSLLPDQARNSAVAIWLYVAIGDCHFFSGNYDKAFVCFKTAADCPQDVANPYIHLRLGQLYFEAHYLDQAAAELQRAWLDAGPKIFSADDSKYLDFLKTRMAI